MEPSFTHVTVDSLIVFIPVYLGNMIPPVAAVAELPFGNPVSERLMGRNKTFRGLYSGIVGGMIGGVLLCWFGVGWFGSQSYCFAVTVGGFMGLGAILGDMAGSCLKRRLRIRPGRPFVPLDQIDFIFGGSCLALPFMPISITDFLIAILVTPVLHLFVNVLAFHLRIKNVWW